ncbi:acetate--CoA ligase family protein [Candidatus Dojkabacteria bacterium]|jgi:acetyltransferase|nr:acetate--CoA ligase family protein [Candidatus Dojkabacteria bacterium]
MNDLFNAKSIAIVGVSEQPNKIGSAIYKNLTNGGFAGKIFLVNPKYEQLNGSKCYPSIDSISEEIDVVCIAIPKQGVKDVVITCAKKLVKDIVIVTAGFGEINEEGKKLEKEILAIAKEAGMRILGPNCLGFMDLENKINLTFAAGAPTKGNIAFISQSGAICTALLDKAIPSNLGFSHFVSIGNKEDINENDLLEYFLKEENVRVLSAYLEEISFGKKLIDQYETSLDPKPFIILKPGKSKEARSAIQSHTGSIAGETEVFNTAVGQHGIILTESISDMFNLMMGFSWLNLPKGNRIAVVTNAGGPAIIATDLIIEKGMKMAKLSEQTMSELSQLLPETANIHNPIDVVGDATADRYEVALKSVINDSNVDAILLLLTPQFVTEIEKTSQVIIDEIKKSDKPIFPVYLGEKSVTIGSKMLLENHIPVYNDIEQAVSVISAMSNFGFWKENRESVGSILKDLGKGQYREEVKNLLQPQTTTLPDELIEKMIQEVGITLPPQVLCKTVEEALAFAQDKYPVVMKAPNFLISHKTDLKALITNIRNQEELIQSFTDLAVLVEKSIKHIPEKLLIQKQMSKKQELIIGAKRDGFSDVYTSKKGFGHLILFGTGGVYTEVYNDHEFTLVPATKNQIIKSISKTKVSKILLGFRGESPLAIARLIQTIEAIQRLVVLYPEIESMDINPLFIDENDVIAIDVKIFVSK